jgi:hypothetical protein
LAILPAWGTTVDGELFEHRTPAHLTGARDGSALLATPLSSDSPEGRPDRFHQRKQYRIGRYDLPDQMVALLPTPTTQDAKNNGSKSQMERNTPPLNAVARCLGLMNLPLPDGSKSLDD